MSTPTRRAVLFGGASLGALAVWPIVSGGTASFLRRILEDHFGEDVLKIDGVEDFVRDYAAQAGQGSFVKRLGAEIYFAWRGDRLHKLGQAEQLETLFLQTILTRSNIIAIHQGRADALDYVDVNPWEPTCGVFLSAFAEDRA